MNDYSWYIWANYIALGLLLFGTHYLYKNNNRIIILYTKNIKHIYHFNNEEDE